MEGMDVKGKDDDGGKDDEPPLKDDEEYAKFFKMLKMGVPLGAVQDAMQEAGLDPEILDFDPEKSLASQQKLKSKAATVLTRTSREPLFLFHYLFDTGTEVFALVSAFVLLSRRSAHEGRREATGHILPNQHHRLLQS